jgi:hypothetical protein
VRVTEIAGADDAFSAVVDAVVTTLSLSSD